MINYRDLDINSRINLKGLLTAWTDIAVERFQKDLDKKVYGAGRGKKRKALNRTEQLRQAWHQQVRLADAQSRVQISFMLYGRFVDMGVGKGVDAALARYARSRRNGEAITRRPKRWYSKRKGHETHRLRELLSRHYLNIPLDLLENALSQRVSVMI